MKYAKMARNSKVRGKKVETYCSIISFCNCFFNNPHENNIVLIMYYRLAIDFILFLQQLNANRNICHLFYVDVKCVGRCFIKSAQILYRVSCCVLSSGYYRSLYILVNHRLPSSLEYSDAPSIPLASTLLEHILKPLHFTYSSCTTGARYNRRMK